MFSSFCLEVIDPCNRTGKITIPMQHVITTRGVADFRGNPAKRDGKDLSLCLLFQKGKCNAGSKCHQVHADPEYITSLREKALSAKNCCALHGDVHSTGFLATPHPIQLVKVINGEEERCYSISSFARTAFFDTLIRGAKNGVVHVTANRICRLHSQSRCKFGKDCKNVHLCCDAHPVEGATIPAKRAPQPITFDLSCGISATSGSHKSSAETTPRSPCKTLDVSAMAPSQELSYISSTWGKPSPQFDMSAFEETIRCLCSELVSKDAPRAPASI